MRMTHKTLKSLVIVGILILKLSEVYVTITDAEIVSDILDQPVL